MTDLNINLHKKQQEVFLSKARFKVCAAGRRSGKSYLSAVELFIHALADKNRFGISLKNKETWYVAPTFQQAKDIMWNQLKTMGEDVIAKTYENTSTIELVNGRTIRLKGSDRPDTLRGVSLAYVVLDEYASMKPDVWDLIIQPALTDTRGEALFIGTPDGKNHFYDIWKQAHDQEDWEAFQFNSTDNPIIHKDELEKARKVMTTQAFRQEFEASFEASGGGAFKPSDFQYRESEFGNGDTYIAVDPAGYADGKNMLASKLRRLDETAISVVEVTEEGWFVRDVIHGRWGVRETSLKIIRAAQQYKPVCVGIEKGSLKNAVMPYLEDQMRRLRIFPRIVDLTHGGQKKTERITWALQGRFENKRIWFKKDAPYIRDLETQLLDFPNPMAHDDLIDSLAYIDQLASVPYFIDELITDDYAPLDDVAGY